MNDLKYLIFKYYECSCFNYADNDLNSVQKIKYYGLIRNHCLEIDCQVKDIEIHLYHH
jgi:hypothetical protein